MESHCDWPHDGRLHGVGAIQAEKRLDFIIGDGCGFGGHDPGVVKWLQQRHNNEQAQNVYRAQ